MDIGGLNKRITIQRKSDLLDDYGQLKNDWFDIKTVWADIRPITGREKLRALEINFELSHTIKIRFDSAFLPVRTLSACRVKYGNRILSITSALDFNEQHEFFILECIEGGPDGQ